MKTAEEKAEQIRQQVFSKIRWGARDQEVLEWLQERHGISGEKAGNWLTAAHQARRKAIRGRALLTLIASAIGVLGAAGFVGFQLWAGVFVIGWGSVLIIMVGFASLGVFFRNLAPLLTGQAGGSVE